MGVESGKSFWLVFAPLIEGHVPRLATNAPGPQQDARTQDGAANQRRRAFSRHDGV
jgi:hypothetical protein